MGYVETLGRLKKLASSLVQRMLEMLLRCNGSMSSLVIPSQQVIGICKVV